MKDSRLVIALARGEVAGLLSFIMNGVFQLLRAVHTNIVT
jgi:hypothetical protein